MVVPSFTYQTDDVRLIYHGQQRRRARNKEDRRHHAVFSLPPVASEMSSSCGALGCLPGLSSQPPILGLL